MNAGRGFPELRSSNYNKRPANEVQVSVYHLITVRSLKFTTGVTALSTVGVCAYSSSSAPALKIASSGGELNGFINPSVPDVRQFLGVPYSLPPTGSRRWLPPSKFQASIPINATNIGPACPQQFNGVKSSPDVYSPNGGNQTEYFPPDAAFSEDCLTLNIWTPAGQNRGIPVIVWFFGGGFVQGGTNSLYYNPQTWVQRTQEHIVITVNFQSNIFGFPNAVHLTEQNLGILDMRLALEWVRDIVVGFGGDPSKITAWGQSAGAIAIDYLSVAYPPDPIFSGMILDSGTAFYPKSVTESFDTSHSDFSSISAALGCNVPKSEIDCLRNATWQDIEAAVQNASSIVNFLPVSDERIVFANYTERSNTGAFSSVPAIIGSNKHELFAVSSYIPGVLFDEKTSDLLTSTYFLCTAALDSQFRMVSARRTYRFRYDGDFPNISPPEYPGAYHAAELPLLFGTAAQCHGPSTAYEDYVSEKFQDLWVKFAKNPQDGLRNAGWSPYEEGKAILIGGADTPLKLLNITELDGACST